MVSFAPSIPGFLLHHLHAVTGIFLFEQTWRFGQSADFSSLHLGFCYDLSKELSLEPWESRAPPQHLLFLSNLSSISFGFCGLSSSGSSSPWDSPWPLCLPAPPPTWLGWPPMAASPLGTAQASSRWCFTRTPLPTSSWTRATWQPRLPSIRMLCSTGSSPRTLGRFWALRTASPSQGVEFGSQRQGEGPVTASGASCSAEDHPIETVEGWGRSLFSQV